MTRQHPVFAAGVAAVLSLLGVWLSSEVDRATLLIGSTGIVLLSVVGGYVAAAERYARTSPRAAAGLAVGWMPLPVILFGAVVLARGFPGGSPFAGTGATPATRSTTTVVYRNGREGDRYTGDNSRAGSGPVLAVLLLACGTAWAGYAAYTAYRGYRGAAPVPPHAPSRGGPVDPGRPPGRRLCVRPRMRSP